MSKFLKALAGYGRILIGRPTMRVDGVRIHTDDQVPAKARRALYRGRYEAAERHLILAHLRPDDRVVEFDGCMGVVSCVLAKRLPEGRLSVFEVNPAAIELLHRNLALNGLRAEVIAAGVGPDDGEETFQISEADIIASSGVAVDGPTTSLKALIWSLKTALNKLTPNVVVMDIEGLEITTLQSAPLDGIRMVIVETHPQITGTEPIEQMTKALTDQGFDYTEHKDVFCFQRTL